MATNNTKLQFVKDFANNKIVVTRIFDADLDTVWDMWTKAELVDQWWAPKPWRSETKSSDFRNGGRRVYAMVGPEGERHWAFGDFSNIVPKKSFEVRDGFSDEKGVVNKNMPQTDWKVVFEKSGNATKVVITLVAPGDHLKQLIEMGFEQGFVMAMENLDEILASQHAKR